MTDPRRGLAKPKKTTSVRDRAGRLTSTKHTTTAMFLRAPRITPSPNSAQLPSFANYFKLRTYSVLDPSTAPGPPPSGAGLFC